MHLHADAKLTPALRRLLVHRVRLRATRLLLAGCLATTGVWLAALASASSPPQMDEAERPGSASARYSGVT